MNYIHISKNMFSKKNGTFHIPDFQDFRKTNLYKSTMVGCLIFYYLSYIFNNCLAKYYNQNIFCCICGIVFYYFQQLCKIRHPYISRRAVDFLRLDSWCIYLFLYKFYTKDHKVRRLPNYFQSNCLYTHIEEVRLFYSKLMHFDILNSYQGYFHKIYTFQSKVNNFNFHHGKQKDNFCSLVSKLKHFFPKNLLDIHKNWLDLWKGQNNFSNYREYQSKFHI